MVSVKICGVTSPQVAAVPADFIGLMCSPLFRRYAPLGQRKSLLDAMKQAKPVLVFVEETAEEIIAECKRLQVNRVQLHGTVSRQAVLPDFIQRIFAVEAVNTDVSHLNAGRDILLFDSLQPGTGTEMTLTPAEVRKAAGHFQFGLAGGLTPDNVAEKVAQFQPQLVDVASGVETQGKKNLNKIMRFIEQVKQS